MDADQVALCCVGVGVSGSRSLFPKVGWFVDGRRLLFELKSVKLWCQGLVGGNGTLLNTGAVDVMFGIGR